MKAFIYSEPKSLAELESLMNRYGSSASILAGGTDLINQIHHGKCSPEIVVSLRSVSEFSHSVVETDEGIEIGALCTLTTVTGQPLIQQRYQALAEAAVKVGSKQIRNRGTVVGNVCNASPAADTVTALLLFDANVRVVGPSGKRRSVPLEDFILGPGQTVLKFNDVVESIVLPKSKDQTVSAYLKLSRREGVDLATVGVATCIDSLGNSKIALGAVGPKAFRAVVAEQQLIGGSWDEDKLEMAVRLAQDASSPITDLRASGEYRRAMIGSLLRQAFESTKARFEAWKGASR